MCVMKFEKKIQNEFCMFFLFGARVFDGSRINDQVFFVLFFSLNKDSAEKSERGAMILISVSLFFFSSFIKCKLVFDEQIIDCQTVELSIFVSFIF